MYSMSIGRRLIWFSCGVASAVTAKLAKDKYGECEILYCDTLRYEHPDNLRFIKDVSEWVGQEIKILSSDKYEDIYDVFNKTGYLVGPLGARCTTELKKNVRKKYQQVDDIHYFGLTFDEVKRIERFKQNNPELNTEWLLYDKSITKNDCFEILTDSGIELPEMYRLGYSNNNCIGCVKGGKKYWSKIRNDFPNHYSKMAVQERLMNVAINSITIDGVKSRIFLDELSTDSKYKDKENNMECGVMC